MSTSSIFNGTLTIDTFLPYMRDVTRCEQSLRELNLMWRMIESSAKMNCPVESKLILPTMAAARAGFNRLEEELVTSLVTEKVGNVLEEIGTQAQYVIDIVVRNLYERTADVGFLATDRELCSFVAGQTSNGDAAADAIRLRLRAYRDKYTVYDEIMLLDTQGNVLVQIDESSPVEGSTDALIAQTLASETYVETFRATDLRPTKHQALIYSRRMLHPETGVPVGIICLCFHFEAEMAMIFQSHRDSEARANMLLLDADDRVIASADELWIPVGARVPVNREGTRGLMVYAGREYLVRTYPAAGYQGYMGPPGWQGQAMIPVDVAFHGKNRRVLSDMPAAITEGLLSHARSFCPPLYEIMTAADTIRRVVWNGQVMTAGKFGDMSKLKTVLDQISETGTRSNELFVQSISDLYETALASSLSDAELVSHLLVDLLDRNLYERSNDCRWWALTPELRHALASGEIDYETAENLAGILQYINSLYTVYARLFVYDRDGRIIAGSRRDDTVSPLNETSIDETSLAAVLALRNPQHYHVSAFEPSPFYEGRPTYIYHAAIRSPHNDQEVVGGIGIVFDSEVEFAAMLKGALADKTDMTALFIDRRGYVISSTDPARPVGSRLAMEPALLSQPNGACHSRILLHDEHYAVMGCAVSSGYREFKTSDGYVDDVLAVVFHRFGEVCERSRALKQGDSLIEENASHAGGDEYATFYIDDMLFAVPSEAAVEAFPATEISPVSMGNRRERIGVISQQRFAQGNSYAWVFDLGCMMRGSPSPIGSSSQVVILRHQEKDVGILVDELHGVPKFTTAQVKPTPFAAMSDKLLVKQVVQANQGRLLIQVLDVAQLMTCISDASVPALLAPVPP